MISHHPETDLIAEYAAGSLSFGPALCMASHIEHCPHCSAQVANFSLLGSQLLNSQVTAAASDESIEDSLFERTFARIEQDDSDPHDILQASKPGLIADNTPRSLSAILPNGLDSIDWKPMAGGVSSHVLSVGDDGHQVKLLRVNRGRGVFTHTHTGTEYTALLQGGYSDELGNFRKGDFIECNSDHQHTPVAHQDQDCILLTAVAGNLKFTGKLARLINPFFKF